MSSLDAYDGKIIMLSSKNCPACNSLKAEAEKDPEIKNNLVVLDVEESQLAKDIAEVMDVRSVPFLVSVSKKDEKTVVLCAVDREECVEVEKSE
jgi:thioredoxin-related protein